jgi:hypothetical protein
MPKIPDGKEPGKLTAQELGIDTTKGDVLRRELMEEIKNYENASMTTAVVERMEKIMVKSMAQKDKIIMAQRLHELELEKRHNEEIAKVREE